MPETRISDEDWDGLAEMACRVCGELSCSHLDEEAYMLSCMDEGPTCSICDGLGHGYPGGSPCPLEDSGRYEYEEASF